MLDGRTRLARGSRSAGDRRRRGGDDGGARRRARRPAHVLCEKTDMVGGITSTSGGTIWVPGSSQSVKAGVPDTSAAAQTFLDAVVGARGGDAERRAFLEAGPKALDYLEARSDLGARGVPRASRLHQEHAGRGVWRARAGAAAVRRAEARRRFRARAAAAPGVPRAGRHDADARGHSVAAASVPLGEEFLHVARMLTRYGWTGCATSAAPIWSWATHRWPPALQPAQAERADPVRHVAGGACAGGRSAWSARWIRSAGRTAIRARRGVVLATGGVCWNKELREKLFPAPAREYSLAPETNTGDGIATALTCPGAALDDKMDSAGLWMPCSIMKRPDGTPRSVRISSSTALSPG